MHWIIADDEADILNLVKIMTQVWGHTPITFENGQRVWDWLDGIESGTYDGPQPDLAIMDIRMPGYRGDQIARRMRQIPVLQKMPIVLMTAFVMSDSEMADMRARAGVDHIVNKPLPEAMQLQELLHRVIEKKREGA